MAAMRRSYDCLAYGYGGACSIVLCRNHTSLDLVETKTLTRLQSAFAKGRPALVTFVTGGDPTPNASAAILSVAEHLGVSL